MRKHHERMLLLSSHPHHVSKLVFITTLHHAMVTSWHPLQHTACASPLSGKATAA